MPFRLLNKEVGKHRKLNGGNHKYKSLNINNHHGGSFKINTQHGYHPLAFYSFLPRGDHQFSSSLKSSSQFISPPKGGYLVNLHHVRFPPHYFNSFTVAPPWPTTLVDPEKTAAIHGFWNVFPLGVLFGDLLGLLPLGPKLSCSIEVVMTSR